MIGQKCSVNSCDRTRPEYPFRGDMCDAHYQRKLGGRDLDSPITRRHLSGGVRDASGRKQCRDCFLWLPEDKFYTSSRFPGGLANHCKMCHRAKSHGTTTFALMKLLSDQGGLCAACFSEIEMLSACIDHDHSCCPSEKSCGKCIRGLLCGKCNSGLGFFDDNPQKLIDAAEYLKWGYLDG